jgi:hypothetical protein
VAVAAISTGKVICFRCRRAREGACLCAAPTAPAGEPLLALRARRMTVLGLWLAGAALAGSLLGAMLAALGG